MKIKITNLSCYVEASEPERTWLHEYLTMRDPQARFHGGSPFIHHFNIVSNSFPTGYLPAVKKAAREHGFEITRVDFRRPPAEVDPTADLSWLRDYQLEALNACLRVGRGVVKAPTAAGKTEIFAALCKSVPCRWLFVVHRAQLASQAAERLALRTGELAGLVGKGKWEDEARVVCATFQTLYQARRTPKGKAFLESIHGVVVDEVHSIAAETFYAVMMAMSNAYWRIGLSATPLDREDQKSQVVVAALGPVMHEIKTQALIAEGLLAVPEIRMTRLYQDSEKTKFFGTNKEGPGIYEELVVRSKERNDLILRQVLEVEKPCLVFVKRIRHGRILRKLLEEAGVKVDFVHGAHSPEERKKLTEALASGEIDAVVSSDVMAEGVDIPTLRSVVLASGGTSKISTLQKIGRGMRVTAEKRTFQVRDVLDQGHPWIERHAKMRKMAFEKEGHKVQVLGGGK